MRVWCCLKAGLCVVAEAAALFAAAGTVAIPGFWAYLAIFAVVMIVSFAALDPDLLRERMRPGGKKPPLALRVFSLVLPQGTRLRDPARRQDRQHELCWAARSGTLTGAADCPREGDTCDRRRW